MSTQKVYVQLIDGTTVWVPVNASHLRDDQFQILEDEEYTDNMDPNYLFEFYPGDIVELGLHTFTDGRKEKTAKKLVTKGQWPDRKFNEFKFKATQGQLMIDPITAQLYRTEIARINKEHSAGQFFYPNLIDTAVKLDALTLTD